MSDLRTRGRSNGRTIGHVTVRRSDGPMVRGRTAVAAALALAVIAAMGCSTLDKAVGKVPWFTTMRDQPAIRPFELPRVPPEGSVPVTGREDSLDLLLDLKNVVNPVRADSASLARGRLVYEQYCIVCHGPAGHGDGTVVAKFVPPPDLTADPTKQRSDGYLYAMIRQGRGIMPRYGDKVRGADRWSVVNYVRQLQGALPPEQAAPRATARVPAGGPR
jgi:mono/diheme cytochrome c family protein